MEELLQESKRRFKSESLKISKPLRLKEIGELKVDRLTTTIGEFNRLMGGGIVVGSLTLVGGDPGIGKSTLMLQLSDSLAKTGQKVLYVCGEESCEQTSMRAARLGVTAENLYLFNETALSSIKAQVEQLQPDVLIVDSIQICYKDEVTSAPGSVTQVREVTQELMHLAKGRHMATFIIGHVTKTGEIAGPKVLEHLVDTVLYFEGDKQHQNRLVRVVKNRFGPTDEIGVFQMKQQGLVEVVNPSELFLEERQKGMVGSCITPMLEGTRPLLIEAQALVTTTGYATPMRKCAGLDQNRLALLLAVLEKRVRFQFHRCDVFVSIAGGMRVTEPAVDLGVMVAIASSWKNRPIDPETIVIGEVGLGGEVRAVSRLESRLKEAKLLGFKRAVIPKKGAKQLEIKDLDLTPVDRLEEAINALLN
jgi:DNA repair protein RadA/Sms